MSVWRPKRGFADLKVVHPTVPTGGLWRPEAYRANLVGLLSKRDSIPNRVTLLLKLNGIMR